MHETHRSIATAILVDDAGRLVFQLRDNLPTIGHPDHWGLFGGRVEAGESPRAAIVRELREELGLAVNERRLIEHGAFAETPTKTVHLFSYAAGGTIDPARLSEGQGLGRFAPHVLRNLADGSLDGHPMIPIVITMVRHFLGAEPESSAPAF
jgi:8-oxo-dGTP diphosphatase